MDEAEHTTDSAERRQSMKRRIFTMMMAVMMLVSMMATSAMAATVETGEKELHSVTVDAELLATGGSAYKNVDLSLALAGYASGWSTDFAVNFSTIPSNAKVESVEINPGKVSAGGPVTSAIVVTKLAVTPPSGREVELTFNKNGMETMAFYDQTARGQWILRIYGTNVGQSLGSIKYASTKVTIWYTLD